jgi:hypothetical protein
MNKILLTAIALMSYGICDDLPKIKEGLWESTTEFNHPINGKQKTTSKTCMNTETMLDFYTQATKSLGNCDKNIKNKSDGFSVSFKCKLMGMDISVNSEITGDLSKKITSNSKSVTSSGGNIINETVNKGVSVYLGPCPKDLNPGDVLTDGKKNYG